MNRLRGAGCSLLFVICMVLGSASGWTGREPVRQPAKKSAAVAAPISIHSGGRGGPSIQMKDGRPLPSRFPGADLAAERIHSGSAEPLGLASADLDEDGLPDLVAAYAFIEGGYLVLHFGNVDALYQNAPRARARRTSGDFVDGPFLPDARVIEVLAGPDFVVAGDFDADGHLDITAGERTHERLAFYRGDGSGGFAGVE